MRPGVMRQAVCYLAAHVTVYRDNRDWWVGVYRDTEHHRVYVCLAPTIVARWTP